MSSLKLFCEPFYYIKKFLFWNILWRAAPTLGFGNANEGIGNFGPTINLNRYSWARSVTSPETFPFAHQGVPKAFQGIPKTYWICTFSENAYFFLWGFPWNLCDARGLLDPLGDHTVSRKDFEKHGSGSDQNTRIQITLLTNIQSPRTDRRAM